MLSFWVKYSIHNMWTKYTADSPVVGVNDIPNHFLQKEGVKKDIEDGLLVQREPVFPDRNLSPKAVESPFAGYSWKDLESEYVMYLLNKNKWNITRASKEAGINRSTFDSRMRKLGIYKG